MPGNPNPEDRATGMFPYALTASSYTNNLPCDQTQTASATFTLLIEGCASTLTICSGGGSGYFIDYTDSVDFAAGQTCTNEIVVVGDTGTYVTWAGAALLLRAD